MNDDDADGTPGGEDEGWPVVLDDHVTEAGRLVVDEVGIVVVGPNGDHVLDQWWDWFYAVERTGPVSVTLWAAAASDTRLRFRSQEHCAAFLAAIPAEARQEMEDYRLALGKGAIPEVAMSFESAATRTDPLRGGGDPEQIPRPADQARSRFASTETLWVAAVLAGLIGLFFLTMNPKVQAGNGYLYECPSPLRMATAGDWLDVYPVDGPDDGSSLTQERYESLANAPGVWRACRAENWRVGGVGGVLMVVAIGTAIAAMAWRRGAGAR